MNSPHRPRRPYALRLSTLLSLGLSCALAGASSRLPAQERSVRPGINDSFRSPEVGDFVERFEREGREIFDLRERIVGELGLRPGMAVADIGAGTGLFTHMFAREVGRDGVVYAVDIAKEFVEHVESSAREQGLPHVRGVVCRDDDAMLPEASIDLAFVCDTYHHFEYPLRTTRSIHRALKPGGRLVVIDFERIEGKSSSWILNHVRAGKEEFTKEITSCGFELRGEEEFLAQNYFLRFARERAGRPAEAEADGHGHGHGHGRRSVEAWARILDSKERDAWQRPAEVLERLGDLSGKTVVDLGCGTGYFTRRLARTGARVVAIDVRKDLLDHLSLRLEAEGIDASRVETRCVPPSTPRLAPGSADVVLIVDTYHHVSSRPRYFAEVRKGLRDGGWLAIVDYERKATPHGPPMAMRLSPGRVLSELVEAGYREFRVDTELLPHQYLILAR